MRLIVFSAARISSHHTLLAMDNRNLLFFILHTYSGNLVSRIEGIHQGGVGGGVDGSSSLQHKRVDDVGYTYYVNVNKE